MNIPGSRSSSRSARRARYTKMATALCLVTCITVAAAIPASAAPEVCGDLVGEDGIKASDALSLLKAAVGVQQELTCPSSVADVLSFDAIWSPVNLPGNNGSTLVKPVVCRTGEHIGRANEVALIAVSGTASPSTAALDVLYIEPIVSRDGGAFTLLMSGVAAESLSDGTAHASTVIALPLEVGVQYVFGAGFGSNSEVALSVASCQGTVQIVRPQL